MFINDRAICDRTGGGGHARAVPCDLSMHHQHAASGCTCKTFGTPSAYTIKYITKSEDILQREVQGDDHNVISAHPARINGTSGNDGDGCRQQQGANICVTIRLMRSPPAAPSTTAVHSQ
jgi:hypothetical protein